MIRVGGSGCEDVEEYQDEAGRGQEADNTIASGQEAEQTGHFQGRPMVRRCGPVHRHCRAFEGVAPDPAFHAACGGQSRSRLNVRPPIFPAASTIVGAAHFALRYDYERVKMPASPASCIYWDTMSESEIDRVLEIAAKLSSLRPQAQRSGGVSGEAGQVSGEAGQVASNPVARPANPGAQAQSDKP